MSYQLNKTNGTLLTELIDGQIDNSTTNLTFVGRNYTGYGEAFNENFIKLLENFSNTAAPSNPIEGQLWWDVSEKRLKVFDSLEWKATGNPYIQNTRPQMIAGDLWIDNDNNKIYAYDGSDLINIGPLYSVLQKESGFRIESILDSTARSRTVTKLFNSSVLVAVISDRQFTPQYASRITELVTSENPDGIIFKGINVVDSSFKFYGTASSANALVTAGGTVRTADSFLPSNANGTTVGTLTIANPGGLTIGTSQNTVQKIIGPRFYIENQLLDHDISLRIKSSALGGGVNIDALYIDASTARIGVFQDNPEYTFDISGDLRVTGNLLVEGTRTTIEVEELKVKDKIIEIGVTDDSTEPDDSAADTSGISVNSLNGSKDFIWKQSTNSWSSNVNLNLLNENLTFKIAGQDKITMNSIHESINYATGLVEIGTLEYLNVDNINLNNTAIKSGALISLGDLSDSPLPLNLIGTNGINITSHGDIAIQDNQKITGLADPTDNQDAATKFYVDDQIASAPVVFSLDVTGLGTGETLQNSVRDFLQDMYPASQINNTKVANIHTTSYAGATVSGIVIDARLDTEPNNGEVLTVSEITVDKNGTSNQPVVRSIVGENTASGSATIIPTRAMMTYISNGTNWIYDGTLTYT